MMNLRVLDMIVFARVCFQRRFVMSIHTYRDRFILIRVTQTMGALSGRIFFITTRGHFLIFFQLFHLKRVCLFLSNRIWKCSTCGRASQMRHDETVENGDVIRSVPRIIEARSLGQQWSRWRGWSWPRWPTYHRQ